MALVGLDVDVARAVACGLREQGVEHADDGCVAGRLQQVFDGGQLLHHAREVGIALDLAHHRGGARFAVRIGGADALGQGRGIERQQLLHGVLAQHFGQRARVGAGAVPQHQLVAVVLQQQLGGAGKSVGQGVAH